MTIKTWLDNAIQDAERRGLGALRPLLESLARATSALRTADWNHDASGDSDWSPASAASISPGGPSAEADPSRRSSRAEADAS
jgi:hypothetical protein